MKYLTSIYLLTLIGAIVSCSTDKPLIYSKGYIVGTNENLRTDGYYIDSRLLSENEDRNRNKGTSITTPIFFYPDGTVKVWPGLKNEIVVDSFLAVKHDLGSTGIYQIENDTITIELWRRDSGTILHLRRVNYCFQIQQGLIRFIGYRNEDNSIRPVDEQYMITLIFRENNNMPVVTNNWIKEKKKWNK